MFRVRFAVVFGVCRVRPDPPENVAGMYCCVAGGPRRGAARDSGSGLHGRERHVPRGRVRVLRRMGMLRGDLRRRQAPRRPRLRAEIRRRGVRRALLQGRPEPRDPVKDVSAELPTDYFSRHLKVNTLDLFHICTVAKSFSTVGDHTAVVSPRKNNQVACHVTYSAFPICV